MAANILNIRISTAVRPGWIVYTLGNFVVGMMTLNECAEGSRQPAEFDLMHISSYDGLLADQFRKAGTD